MECVESEQEEQRDTKQQKVLGKHLYSRREFFRGYSVYKANIDGCSQDLIKVIKIIG